MKNRNPARPAPFPSNRMLTPVVALALLTASGAGVLGDLTAPEGRKPIGTFVPVGGSVLADVALERLKVGNAHFVDERSTQTNKDARRRAEVAEKQKPFAIVVSCSDSRVGPEVVFDQGVGDLFVVRTAGHVVDDVGLGSIEYAVEHLGASLILVLGHERCGAVVATVAGGKVQGHLPAIVEAIKPAVDKTQGQPGDAVDNAVRAHVREVAALLNEAGPILAERVKAGKLKVAGARYDLDTGRVEVIE